MIVRAIFWIGLVALLMPHEPDLGFGRPAADSVPAAAGLTAMRSNFEHLGGLCGAGERACSAGINMPGSIGTFRALAMRSLEQVRAEIEQSRHARGGL